MQPIPEQILQMMPPEEREWIMTGPPDADLVSRVSNRLDLLGIQHEGVGRQVADGEGFIEIGLDPYAEDTARRIGSSVPPPRCGSSSDRGGGSARAGQCRRCRVRP